MLKKNVESNKNAKNCRSTAKKTYKCHTERKAKLVVEPRRGDTIVSVSHPHYYTNKELPGVYSSVGISSILRVMPWYEKAH